MFKLAQTNFLQIDIRVFFGVSIDGCYVELQIICEPLEKHIFRNKFSEKTVIDSDLEQVIQNKM